MAASNRCFTCEKAPGAYFCTGCKVYFCMKDLKNHHNQLLQELDVLVGDRDDLQEKISKAAQQTQSIGGLLSQIDEWEKLTLAKVKQAANQARQQASSIMNAKHTEIRKKLETFSKELVNMKETEEFVHDDLTRLQQMIPDLNQDLKQLAHPSSVELRTEQSNQVDWTRLIYVEQKAARIEPGKQQKQSNGLYIFSYVIFSERSVKIPLTFQQKYPPSEMSIV